MIAIFGGRERSRRPTSDRPVLVEHWHNKKRQDDAADIIDRMARSIKEE